MMKHTKEIEITKELILPFVKRKPTVREPTLELPVPSHQERPARDEEQTKEITLRGVWTIEI